MYVVDWGDADNQLVVWRFEGYWNMPEYCRSFNTLKHLIREQSHHVNVMIDIRQICRGTEHLVDILVKDIKQHPQNLGEVVIITERQHWPLHTGGFPHFVETVDEAYHRIDVVAFE